MVNHTVNMVNGFQLLNHIITILYSWDKSNLVLCIMLANMFIWVFYKALWKNLDKLFGQLNIILYFWMRVANILLRIFMSMFMRTIAC